MALALFLWRTVVQAVAALALSGGGAIRSEEFVSVTDKGPPVVMVSGAFGAGAYRAQARRLAAYGFNVLLVDGRDLVGNEDGGLKAAIREAKASPHALPGKVAMVGFSLGGGQLLGHAGSWRDEVRAIVVMYPATVALPDPAALAETIRVPVLMLAGEADRMGDCCTIERARAIAAAARAHHAPLVLRSYPNTAHDFIVEGTVGYNRTVAANAWYRTVGWLYRFPR